MAGVVRLWGAALVMLCLWGWPVQVWAGVPPSLIEVKPGVLVAGSKGVSVVVLGTDMIPGTVIRWGGTQLLTTLYSDVSGSAVVPDALLADPGIGVIDVSNSEGVSNSIGVPVTESFSKQLEPVLYVAAGLLGAMAFIWGMGTRL